MNQAEERVELERRASQTAALLPDILTAAYHAADLMTSGRHPRAKAGQSETFWQFRDYAPGDPMASIDWRQSARLDQRLLVRQTEWEQPQTLMLWCGGGEDFDYGDRGTEAKRFRGQVITLALAIVALRQGERVGLWGSAEPPRAGVHFVNDLAEQLLTEELSFTEATPQPGATHVLVSDFHQPPEDLVAAFAKARDAQGRALAVVVEDPSEAHFPFAGSTRFEGSRGEARRFFGDAQAVREDYLSAREQHHAALNEAVRGGGERVFFHLTDAPLAPLMLSIVDHLEGAAG
ncbi:MAG: DUF58 domain-containing protein [Parvularculaceae bacterium]|nr:DUF58 domain-containing protein [Parvularculaceae bacterium]